MVTPTKEVSWTQRRAKLIAIIGAALVTIGIASAQDQAPMVNDICGIYLANDSATPPPILSLMKKRSVPAAEACIDGKGTVTYFSSVTSVKTGLTRVCRFEVSPPTIPDANRRPTVPLRVFMNVSTNAMCPLQNSPSYIPANGVSEGVFLNLLRFTDHLCLAQKNEFHPFAPTVTAQRKLAAMCAILADKDQSLRARLKGVALDNQSVGPHFLTYQLLLRSGAPGGHTWVLSVDFEQTGVEIRDVEGLGSK